MSTNTTQICKFDIKRKKASLQEIGARIDDLYRIHTSSGKAKQRIDVDKSDLRNEAQQLTDDIKRLEDHLTSLIKQAKRQQRRELECSHQLEGQGRNEERVQSDAHNASVLEGGGGTSQSFPILFQDTLYVL
eukprot:Tamp_04920.p4 GENE.Tamp_04920~~Tamp_04920.p4  ORF type:complete len:132 (-),score=14.94 Tamp_04920:308-703(-)